ncbi:unnamed protein product [Amoebophrya sp. A25]|nr:unnamed protein product [Amoebophrya sp. A25]|eukprot:GSA25T00023868001.1
MQRFFAASRGALARSYNASPSVVNGRTTTRVFGGLQARFFSSALRQATEDLRASLLQKPVIDLDAAGLDAASKTASEPAKQAAVEEGASNVQTEQSILDLKGLLTAVEEFQNATKKAMKHPPERVKAFETFVARSILRHTAEGTSSESMKAFANSISRAWTAALESTQFHPRGNKGNEMALVFAGENHLLKVLLTAAVRALEGYGKVAILASSTAHCEELKEMLMQIGGSGPTTGSLPILLSNTPSLVVDGEREPDSDVIVKKLLSTAACFDFAPASVRKMAVDAGNCRVLLPQTLDVENDSLQSITHGLQRRAAADWKDRKEDFYRYEMADRADELLSLLPPAAQKPFQDMLSGVFELIRTFYPTQEHPDSCMADNDRAAAEGASDSLLRKDHTLRFRPNIHFCLQSDGSSLPNALTKMAVLADAMPPEVFAAAKKDPQSQSQQGPPLTLHLLSHKGASTADVTWNKDPLRGFLRMLKRRPDVWRVVEKQIDVDNRQSGCSASPWDAISFDSTPDHKAPDAMFCPPLFVGVRDPHLLPQSFQHRLAEAEGAILPDFPTDCLSLLRLFTVEQTVADADGRPVASLTLPPSELIQAFEPPEEDFADFGDDFGDDDKLLSGLGAGDEDEDDEMDDEEEGALGEEGVDTEGEAEVGGEVEEQLKSSAETMLKSGNNATTLQEGEAPAFASGIPTSDVTGMPTSEATQEKQNEDTPKTEAKTETEMKEGTPVSTGKQSSSQSV